MNSLDHATLSVNIGNAYKELETASEVLGDVQIRLLKQETELSEKIESHCVSSGNSKLGSNDNERAIKTAELFPADVKKIRTTKRDELEAKKNLELAKIKVEAYRVQVRLAELAAGIKTEH